jgi:Secretion system C-terminal sorting domain
MKYFFWLLSINWVALLSAQPSIQWQKTYGGSSYDEAYDIHQTIDGGHILAGITFSNNGDVFGHHGGWDFWVLKLANNGGIEWKKAMGGSLSDIARSVRQTADQGYLVVGFAASNNFDVTGHHGGLTDGWVVKLNSSGSMEWQKAIGGSGRDEIWAMELASDNGCILAGRTNSIDGDVTANQGKYDIWVVKMNESGVIEWQKTLGGSEDEMATSVRQTSDGGYIVGGETSSHDGDITSNHGNVDFWVLKLSASGELEWQKTYGGENADISRDIIESNDGGYVAAGYVGSHNTGDVTGHHGSFDYWVLKLDASGTIVWQKAVGGIQPDWGESVVPAAGGGYVVAGSTYSNDGDVEHNHGSTDFWLVKISEQGELLWQETYGGTKGDDCYSIAKTSDNGFVLAGFTWSTDGDVSGSPNKGQNDFWVIKLSPEPSSPIADLPTSNISLFPNPAETSFTLQTPSADGSSLSVTIHDLLGRALLRAEMPNGGQLDISALPRGVFLVSASDVDGIVWRGKLEKG